MARKTKTRMTAKGEVQDNRTDEKYLLHENGWYICDLRTFRHIIGFKYRRRVQADHNVKEKAVKEVRDRQAAIKVPPYKPWIEGDPEWSPPAPPPEPEKPKVYVLRDAWTVFEEGELQTMKKSTRTSYQEIKKNRLDEHMDRPLVDFDGPFIKGWCGRIKKEGVLPRATMILVRRLLRAAYKDGWLGETMPRVLAFWPDVAKVASLEVPKEKIPTRDEVKLMATQAKDPRARLLAAICGYQGFRVSEALELRVGDVDLIDWRINLTRSLSDGEVCEPKANSKRDPKIAPFIRTLMAEACMGKRESDLLIQTVGGEQMKRQNANTLCAAAATQLGIKRRCGPHSMRHSFMTYVANRAGTTVAMTLGGQASLQAAKRYIRRDKTAEDAAVETLLN